MEKGFILKSNSSKIYHIEPVSSLIYLSFFMKFIIFNLFSKSFWLGLNNG